MQTVDFGITNGGITVTKYIVGDVNGDGSVNSLDRAILSRHLAKWSGYETLPYIK